MIAFVLSNAVCPRLVCVVDDDADIRDSLAELLEEEGYAVITAEDGQDALAKLRASDAPPCVILLDLMMPVMNGSQFVAEQQNDPELAAIPVVLISADSNIKSRAKGLCDEYLAKPLRVETLLDVVERHCA